MRILLITDGLPPRVLGGTGNIVLQIVEGFARKGHSVATLSAAPSPSTKNIGNVTHYEIPERHKRWMHYRSVFSMKRKQEVLDIIRAFKPDIIHAHTIANQCGYAWMPEARTMNIPIVMTAHDVMNIACGRVLGSETSVWPKDLKRCRWTWNPLRSVIIRHTLNKHARVLAVSDALRGFMERFGFTNLTTAHNGIDTDFWTPMERASARRKFKLPEDQPLFLLAGRLGPDKGTDLIAQTLPEGAGLILAGAAHLGPFARIKNRVWYFANQSTEDMRALYAAANAVLVPSRCLDCFPTVCLEAMSCERAVLATNWGGAKESVVDEKTGWVMDPIDEALWHAKMQWCAQHADDCDRIGKEGRMHMLKQFSLDRFLKDLETIYKEEQVV